MSYIVRGIDIENLLKGQILKNFQILIFVLKGQLKILVCQ